LRQIYPNVIKDTLQRWWAQRRLERTPLVTSSRDRRRITVRGLEVEQVVSIVQCQWHWSRTRAANVGPHGNAAKVLEFLNACRDLAQRTLQTPKAFPENFVRTTIGNFLYTPDEYAPPLSDLKLSLNTALRYWSILQSGDPDYQPRDEDRNVMGRFLNALLPMCKERRFFSTSGGHFSTSGGHVGMEPAEVQPGDRV